MRSALAMRGQFGRIGRSLRVIHADYAQPLDVPQLADEAGMSVPSFHSHFKAITQVSPMQYLKSTRLHQARLLMVREDLTAEAAGYAVGYAAVAVQPRIQAPVRPDAGEGNAAHARQLRDSGSLRGCAIRVVALTCIDVH